MPSVTTVWATDFPVSVTENPVTLTVIAQSLALGRVGEAAFRGKYGEYSENLTQKGASALIFTKRGIKQRPHACVISDRGSVRWLSRPFSGLTDVKRKIAHTAAGAVRRSVH